MRQLPHVEKKVKQPQRPRIKDWNQNKRKMKHERHVWKATTIIHRNEKIKRNTNELYEEHPIKS